MLSFSEEFFCEEIRDGFKISSTMKHAWAAQLEVLHVLDRVFKECNLTYYAFWGTLLGCIRHKGFIPWDDDIDIAMKREDYDKFLAMAQSVLPKDFLVLNVNTNDEYEQSFLRINNSRFIDISEKRLQQFHGCPFVVGVDIFPLDYLPVREEDVVIQKELLKMISYMGPLAARLENMQEGERKEWQQSKEVIEEGVVTLEENCGMKFDRTKPLRNQLHRLFDRICAGYSQNVSSTLTSMPEHMRENGFYLTEELFAEIEYKKFESMELPVPRGYHEILTALYGDYMTPVQGTAEHDYPFYKEQLQLLQKQGKWLNVQP